MLTFEAPKGSDRRGGGRAALYILCYQLGYAGRKFKDRNASAHLTVGITFIYRYVTLTLRKRGTLS